MTRNKVIEPPSFWIFAILILSIWTILSLTLLHRESNNRKLSSASFTTKYLKLFSITCFISGFITPLCTLLTYVKGLCTFVRLIAMIALVIQFYSMSGYQLSRVYYCFANEQIRVDSFQLEVCLFLSN